MNIIENLRKYDLQLPNVSIPGGSYSSVNVRGKIAYVAIQFPILNEEYFYRGRLGGGITTEEGNKAIQLSSLNILAQINDKIGFEKIEGLNHIDIYYQSEEDWDDGPLVADGASDLFVNILENKGKHSRAIFGVHKLPRNFCVGLSSSFTLI